MRTGRTQPPSRASACEALRSATAGHSVSIWLRLNPATSEQHHLREYRLHIPDGYTPPARMPLVLYFHGAGGTAAQADRDSGWSSLADREHFLVAYPQGLPFGAGAPPAWASAGPIDLGIADLAFVHAVLADIERRVCVDNGAIFAVGMSSGGGMAGYLACALSSTISAAAPVAANNYVLTKLGCRPTTAVSILEVHGTADQVVPYYGTSARISPQWPLPSIHTWVTDWAQLDHCSSRPIVSSTHHETIYHYRPCAAGTEVTLYRIDGGGHPYPPARRTPQQRRDLPVLQGPPTLAQPSRQAPHRHRQRQRPQHSDNRHVTPGWGVGTPRPRETVSHLADRPAAGLDYGHHFTGRGAWPHDSGADLCSR